MELSATKTKRIQDFKAVLDNAGIKVIQFTEYHWRTPDFDIWPTTQRIRVHGKEFTERVSPEGLAARLAQNS